MNSLVITIIGGIAAAVSTISFVPQAVKIIRTRDTKSISLGMYSTTVLGFVLWMSYGLLLWSWPLIASNMICLVLSAFILTMKVLPASGKKALADSVPGVSPRRVKPVKAT